MALKPRKQRKHYSYLFLLNEKTFLRYLRGQYLIFSFDVNCIGSYKFSKTKKIIHDNNHFLFKKLEMLIDNLENENKLIYAPFCFSSWVVKDDYKILKKINSKIKKENNKKSKYKREERQLSRLNLWSRGWVAFESKKLNAPDIDNPMITHRDKKWWQKGYDDAKEDIGLKQPM
ncbi:hypothetical protein GLP30_17175 [Photobacterium phosphoreum]|uniref:Uncharacterized protein n=1 Tax=Photobacterium phosphoreum TaxID=659 RepID=A0AAW5A4G7_PHOPO|nr:hypothetical protein [Photobacterium phosphoreum]MCD9492614.1 hypothetical protein [Photobacterium phosphoreum]MCF2191821.1 hypothetical protein [Photobacterium phosphoreum]MCF2303446.1 hypothetical protein [Photobacterium phosphoreum]